MTSNVICINYALMQVHTETKWTHAHKNGLIASQVGKMFLMVPLMNCYRVKTS